MPKTYATDKPTTKAAISPFLNGPRRRMRPKRSEKSGRVTVSRPSSRLWYAGTQRIWSQTVEFRRAHDSGPPALARPRARTTDLLAGHTLSSSAWSRRSAARGAADFDHPAVRDGRAR